MREGAVVHGFDINEKPAAWAEIEKDAPGSTFVVGDVRDEESQKAWAADVKAAEANAIKEDCDVKSSGQRQAEVPPGVPPPVFFALPEAFGHRAQAAGHRASCPCAFPSPRVP